MRTEENLLPNNFFKFTAKYDTPTTPEHSLNGQIFLIGNVKRSFDEIFW